jgi:hypothetical protein
MFTFVLYSYWIIKEVKSKNKFSNRVNLLCIKTLLDRRATYF